MSAGSAAELLDRLAALAASGSAGEAARALTNTARTVRDDRAAGARAILALYRGAGSLDDVVLYRDGEPLGPENERFDALRRELFDLSVASL